MKVYGKVLLGFLSVLPLVSAILFFGSFIYLYQTNSNDFFEFVITRPELVTIFNVLFSFSAYGPFIFYIVHAARNPNLADRRVAWILLIVFLGFFVMPFYWYMFIWHDSYYG